jgi:predicted nucleotidyltransferase
LTAPELGTTLVYMWSAEQTRAVARRRLAREAERERELTERRTEARTHGEELARSIAEHDKGVTRIIGFGSAFDDRLPFTFSSDIDLAVMGGTIVGWKIAEQFAICHERFTQWIDDLIQAEE